MQAVLFENGKFRLADIPAPQAGEGQALARVTLAGICHTDLELLAGYKGFRGVPGHEFVGEVVAAPDRPELVGRRVTADINLGCGVCRFCRADNPRHCQQRRVLGILGAQGAFAEFMALPLANLRQVPDGLDEQSAVFAEPLAAALEISQQVHLTAGQKMLVLGDGKLGLLCALGLCHFNPGLLLAGRHPEKLAIAGARGVATVLLGREETAQETAGRLGGFQVVVEATGNPDGLALAMELVEPEGVIVAKTTSHQKSPLDLARLVVNEVTLVGSRCGNLDLALAYLARGWVDVSGLVAGRFPLADFSAAWEAANAKGALKVLLRP